MTEREAALVSSKVLVDGHQGTLIKKSYGSCLGGSRVHLLCIMKEQTI